MLKPLLLSFLVVSSACTSPEGGAERAGHTVLVQGAGKLGGCGIGELDERSSGPEVAAVGSDGRVHVARREAGGWTTEVVDEVGGEQIQLALGSIGPKGLRALVSVGVEEGGEDEGGRGIAWMLWREQGLWQRRVLLRDAALLHAVAIGDVDPNAPGDEVVVAGFTRQVHLVTLTSAGPTSRVIGDLPGNAKGLALGLGGVVVACDDGSLVRLLPGLEGAGWDTEVLARHADPLARLSVRQGGERGDAALYCGNDGVLRLWKEGVGTEIYRAEDRLRGAVFVDGDGGLASAGYDHTVRLHSELAVEDGEIAFTDADKLHHLAAGELDGEPVLVCCGYSGNLVLIPAR